MRPRSSRVTNILATTWAGNWLRRINLSMWVSSGCKSAKRRASSALRSAGDGVILCVVAKAAEGQENSGRCRGTPEDIVDALDELGATLDQLMRALTAWCIHAPRNSENFPALFQGMARCEERAAVHCCFDDERAEG